MFTATQQNQLKSVAHNLVELDRLTNELRLKFPEKFHSNGIARFLPGAVADDKPETMWARRFYDQPTRTDCYLSYVRKYVKPVLSPLGEAA